jgi:hypothetical protein
MNNFKCDCGPEVRVSEYQNQSVQTPPWWWSTKFSREQNSDICIDNCLVDEIKDLWSKGIVTTGNCCGHNHCFPYIGVIEEHIWIMKSLGYEVQNNPMDESREDSFIPKSIKQTPKQKEKSC